MITVHTLHNSGSGAGRVHSLRLKLYVFSLGCKVDYLGQPRQVRLFHCSLKGKFTNRLSTQKDDSLDSYVTQGGVFKSALSSSKSSGLLEIKRYNVLSHMTI